MQERSRRRDGPTSRPGAPVPRRPQHGSTAHTRLTALQRTAGNAAVTTLLRSGPPPPLQRDFTQESPVPDGGWIKKWRVKVKGTATVTADGTPTKRPVATNMVFDVGSSGPVDIAVDLEVTWDEWKKTWRWGDYGWNTSLIGDLPFEYKAFWKASTAAGAMEVAFVSSTDAKMEFHGKEALYEAKPSAQGDTAILTIVTYREGKPMEATARIKVEPPTKKPPPGPTWKERTLVIDDFPPGKATISAEHLSRIEDFWYGLTSETRTAVQNDQLLNGRKVRITGHTSNTDKVPRNFDLGYERALAVAGVLKKLSGNAAATNLAPMTKGERGIATDDPASEVEAAAHRKVTIELWEQQDLVSVLKDLFRGSPP